jgi:hypothetical protein
MAVENSSKINQGIGEMQMRTVTFSGTSIDLSRGLKLSTPPEHVFRKRS